MAGPNEVSAINERVPRSRQRDDAGPATAVSLSRGATSGEGSSVKVMFDLRIDELCYENWDVEEFPYLVWRIAFFCGCVMRIDRWGHIVDYYPVDEQDHDCLTAEYPKREGQ